MSDSSERCVPDAPAIQRLPLLQLILVGLQHVLLMYGGAIAVPLIIGQAAGLSREEIAFLINADLLVAGIATIVQSLGIGPMGIRMPVMMGASFAAVGSMVAMAGMPGIGMQGIFGATIAAGFFGMLIAPFMSKVVRFFPPLVTGTVITSIGLSLFPVAVNWAGGGSSAAQFGSPIYLTIAALVLGTIPFYARLLGEHFRADRHGLGLPAVRGDRHGRPLRHGRGALAASGHPASFRHATVSPGTDPVDVPGGGDYLCRVHRHVPGPG
jgi:xanthine/uracil permease